eukprot:7324044-Prymnesium_polylepis.2
MLHTSSSATSSSGVRPSAPPEPPKMATSSVPMSAAQWLKRGAGGAPLVCGCETRSDALGSTSSELALMRSSAAVGTPLCEPPNRRASSGCNAVAEAPRRASGGAAPGAHCTTGWLHCSRSTCSVYSAFE